MKHILLLILLLSISCSSSKKIDPNLEQAHSDATTAWLYEQYGFINDPQINSLLNRISKRLSSAVHPARLSFRHQAEEMVKIDNWQIFVLNSQEPNAFAGGNGVIFLTGGLLETSKSESELASVIALEMAHQILGHIKNAIISASQMSKPAIILSGEDVVQADIFAAHILKSAHYNPRAALSALSLYSRSEAEEVSSEGAAFIDERRAILASLIQTFPPSVGLTDSTRDFAKLQKKLASERSGM